MRRLSSSRVILLNTLLTASRVVAFDTKLPRPISLHFQHEATSSFRYQSKNSIQLRTIMSAKSKEFRSESSVHHVSDDLVPSFMNKERTKLLTNQTSSLRENGNTVYYWMQRDMRVVDNWALLYGEYLAKKRNVALKVFYVLPPILPKSSDQMPPKVSEMKMTERHGHFLIGGLQVVEEELREKNVPFEVLKPNSQAEVGTCVHEFTRNDAIAVVCDMSPLRHFRNWMEDQSAPLFDESKIPLIQVDAHNVVPVWFASPKREVGARTLRPKINKLLPDFLTHFPEFHGNHADCGTYKSVDWKSCVEFLDMDTNVKPVSWAKPGHKFAKERFREFCNSSTEGLKNFDTLRNDPNYKNVCSNLSPWTNYGQISFQKLALEVRALKKHPNGTASYIEEGIVRRELSDNFVYYSQNNYDDLSTAAEWAQESLALHSSDEREYVYDLDEFVNAKTHDDLWNAAQLQLLTEGQMHGFLRMYWAKKILEWTNSPAEALRIGLYLNDRFALDGNDPNGFTGVGWSIMGIHDMGWKERPIFGKIRYMNYAGCKRKFKVDNFVSRYKNAKVNAISAERKKGDAEKKRKAKDISK